MERACRVIDITAGLEVSKYIKGLPTLDPYLKNGIWWTKVKERKGLQKIFGIQTFYIMMSHQMRANS